MAKQIEIDVVINGKMQKATVSAKKLKNALDGVDKGQDKVSKSNSTMRRNMQGAAAATSNSTKEFAKMSQGMGGLVAVYAQIAAATFAVSAAFQFMKDAMEVRNLMEGQKAFGAVTGVAYASMTRNIREATDGMLGFRDAAQAAAIGTAAGLSRGQLERLGEAAKNVSFALGRDLTDSFNRLVRGVTKAEPELLDELGIVLRLDPALKAYANSIGKSVQDLNQFEKSQAIANEVLGQAEGKFAAIAKIMDPQSAALSQFQSEFSDLANTVKVEVIEGMIPAFNFFKDNINALVGALSLIALPILRQILPNFEAMGVAAQKNFKKAKKAADTAAIASSQFAATSRLASGGAAARASVMETSATRGKKLGIDVKGQGAQEGMLSKRQLAIYRKHLNDKKLLRKKYNKEERMEFRRFMAEQEALLAASQNKQVAIIKRSHMKMRSIYYTTAAVYKKTQTLMVAATGVAAKGMNGLMKLAGWAGLLLFLYEIGNAIYEWINPLTDAEKEFKQYEDRIKGATESQRELTQEINRMNQVLNSDDISLTIDEKLSMKGQALQSLDLEKTLREYRLEGKKGTEVSKEYAAELANTVEEVAKLTGNAGLLDLSRTMRNQGTVTKEAEAALLKYRDATVSVSVAIAQAGDRAKATANALRQIAATDLPYSNAIEVLGIDLAGTTAVIDAARPKVAQLASDLDDLLDPKNSPKQKQRNFKMFTQEFDEEGNFVGSIRRTADELEIEQARILEKRKAFLDELAIPYKVTGLDIVFDKAYEGTGKALQKEMDRRMPIPDYVTAEQDPMGASTNAAIIQTTESQSRMLPKKVAELTREHEAENAELERKVRYQTFLSNTVEKLLEMQDQKVAYQKKDLALVKREGALTSKLGMDSEAREKARLGLMEERLKLTNEDKQAQVEIAKNAVGRLKTLDGTAHTVESLVAIEQDETKELTQQQKAALEAYRLAVAQQAVAQRAVYDAKILNDIERSRLDLLREERKLSREIAENERRRSLEAKRDAVAAENARSPAARAALDVKKINRLRAEERDLTRQITAATTRRQNEESRLFGLVEENGKLIFRQTGDIEKLREARENENILLDKQAELEEDINLIIARRQALIDANVSRTEELLALGNIAKNTTFEGSSAQGGTPGNAAATFGADVKSGLFGASDAGQEYIKAVTALENAGLMNVDAQGNKLTDAQVEERKKEMFKQAHEVSIMNIELKKTEAISGAIGSAFDGLFDAILDGTANFGDAMRGVMSQLLKDMAKAYMQAAAMKALNAVTMSMGIPGLAAKGGVFGPSGSMMPGYAVGGIASGPKSGYPVTLHGTEAVVPLPDGRSIPVAMEGGGQNNNVSVTVNMSGMGQSQQSANGGAGGGVDGQELGRSIAGLVQQHLQDQMRPGGLLNRQGQTGRI